MPQLSPFPLSLTQALEEARKFLPKKLELLMALDLDAPKPYRLDIRVRDTPQKRSLWFASAAEVEAFLKTQKP